MGTQVFDRATVRKFKELKTFLDGFPSSLKSTDSRFDQVIISEGMACVSNGVVVAAKRIANITQDILSVPFEAVDVLPDTDVAIHFSGSDISFGDGSGLQQFRTRVVLISPSLLREVGPYSVTFDRQDLITQLTGLDDVVIGSSFFADKEGKTVAYVKQPTVSFNPQLLLPGLVAMQEEEIVTLNYGFFHSPISVSCGSLIYLIMPLNRRPEEAGIAQDRLALGIAELEKLTNM